MEIVKPKKYSELAIEKIVKEKGSFSGNQYGNAVKDFVAATLTNFCNQNERFAEVVYLTKATLSDCCKTIMKGCGNHISDIDVYRGAVKFYFPNSEIDFQMNIRITGDAPTEEEMAKVPEEPKPKKEPAQKPAKKPEEEKPVPAPKPAPAPKPVPPQKTVAPPKTEEKTKDEAVEKPRKRGRKPVEDDTIQLSLF